MLKKSILPLLVFICSLSWFVWNGSWYQKSQLIVQGYVPDVETKLVVGWDSGHGYNGYERKYFPLDTVLPAGAEKHEIIVRNTGEKNPASSRKDIACNAIYIDGIKKDLREFLPESGKFTRKGIRLVTKGSEISFNSYAEKNIHIELPTNNHSGIAEISINEKVSRHDLYGQNYDDIIHSIDYWVVGQDGSFTIWMDIPRYTVGQLAIHTADRKELRFKAVQVKSETDTSQLLSAEKAEKLLLFENINSVSKKYFHPIQFAFQLIFAALSTWIIFTLVKLWRRNERVADIFFAEKRIVFWSFFLLSVSCFTLWLVAFWPGVMSVDSLKVWRAASLPGVFLNDHPILNVIFYMYLMQIWNNVAVVPFVHILLISLLSATIFFWLYQRGIPLYLLLPFYLLLVFSIPVGLYNLMLWKDIPFAILVVFWGYTMVRLYEMKKEGEEISFQYGLVLVLLWLALALTRHNGIVYLVYIPFLFLLMGFINLRKAGGIIAVLIVAGILLSFLFRATGHVQNANYLTRQGHVFAKQMINRGIQNSIVDAGREYWGILNINQTRSKWDLFHYYLKDRYAYRFLVRSGLNDSYPYLPDPSKHPGSLRIKAMQVYEASYKTSWVYFTWNPLYMLALFPLSILLFPWLPRSAIYSSIILIQVGALLIIVNTFNWRYYYFLYLSSYFLIPIMLLDLRIILEKRQLLRGRDAL